jgi:hypothetical protein
MPPSSAKSVPRRNCPSILSWSQNARGAAPPIRGLKAPPGSRAIVVCVRGCLIACLLAAVGCNTDLTTIDSFPIEVDLSSGAVTIPAEANGESIVATIDTLSPITVVDSFVAPGPVPIPRQREVDLTFMDATSGVTRAIFREVGAFDVHPCPDNGELCRVGEISSSVEINAIIGGDLLSRGAVRFDFPAATMSFFPNIAGNAAARGRSCDAVFESPFAGGGTLQISGAEIVYGSHRVAVSACMHYDAMAAADVDRGADALLIMSTGLGTSILSESAYERYHSLAGSKLAPPLVDLPAATLDTPSGRLSGKLGSIRRIALVGEGSDERGPCKELYASHIMAAELCYDDDAGIDPCPCPDESPFCATAGAIEIDEAIAVVIVSDLEPMLQALRAELRPRLPEVDGLLGVNAMAKLGIDVDYPGKRVVLRCEDDSNCITRPAVRTRNSLDEINACPNMP